MKEEYLPDDFDGRLAHLVEEAGETLAAAGKTQRFGRECVNPELPPADQETNICWLRRELDDLQRAVDRMIECIDGGLAPPDAPDVKSGATAPGASPALGLPSGERS